MCGLFGFLNLGKEKDYSKLINTLATNASIRGTHATGISYNLKNELIIYKKPLPAHKMNFKHFSGVKCITGHTRHATQGDYKTNRNNHPFKGKTEQERFALAHNGIIYNDKALQKSESLPKSSIITDSYVMVQLLEKEKALTFDNIARVTEKLEGYYTFTILDNKNNLYIVKGDSPISIIRLTKSNLIVYASTDEILYKALLEAGMFDEIINKQFEIIDADEGDILKISSSGEITKGYFKPFEYTYNFKNWYEYGILSDISPDSESDYYDNIVSIAKSFGYCQEDIDELLLDGYTLEEIEEYIYTGEEYAYNF